MSSVVQQKSRMSAVLIGSNLLSEPLFTLYGFLAFVLYKDLGASAFQIALMTMLKPVVTILSFYWSAGVRKSRLKSNVLWAGFLMRAPFLFCFWFDSVWYVIGAAVNYMFFYRAAIPAWMEMVRQNLKEGKRGRAFSISSALGYAEGVVLSLAMGGLLDKDPALWKGLLVGAAAVGLLTLVVQAQVPVETEREEVQRPSLKEVIIRPWRDSIQLMKERPDFARYQWGFMVCGFGIMLIQPALPIFCADDLGVSYLEIAAAVSIAKGLGFALSSPIWAKWVDKVSVLKLSSLVFMAAGLFPILLSFSVWGIVWLYVAYFWYGVGQGGSHLVWNMSGPIFAAKEDSSKFTGVNVVSAGLRGAIAPPLGGLLAGLWGPIEVLVIGGALCFYSGVRLLQSRYLKREVVI